MSAGSAVHARVVLPERSGRRKPGPARRRHNLSLVLALTGFVAFAFASPLICLIGAALLFGVWRLERAR